MVMVVYGWGQFCGAFIGLDNEQFKEEAVWWVGGP